MRTLIIVLLLISINSFGQNKKFKWSDETCDYESLYDINKYSEIQLRNCYTLTYNYFFRINHTPSVFKPEDIELLKLDSLDSEYILKINLLKSLDLPRNDYWEDLRKSIMKELEQFYKLSRIAYEGYIEPKVLKNWFYQDSCLNRHVNALFTGGDSLLKDWRELTSILVKENCCPDKVWGEFNKQYDSNKKFDFAKVYVTTFGWWNCAIEHIDPVDNKLDEKTRHEEFRKLFIKTKKQCNEP